MSRRRPSNTHKSSWLVAIALGIITGFSFLCLSGTTSSENEVVSPVEMKAVLTAVSQAIADDYYDKAAAAQWDEIQKRYERQVEAANSRQEALALIRRMLSELHNSHILFYSPEEWRTRQDVLPFSFEKVDGRVFVVKPFGTSSVRFGDEIVQVDGASATALRHRSLAKLDSVYDNPLYGQNQTAELTVVRDGKRITVEATRVPYHRSDIVVDELGAGVVHLSLSELPTAGASAQLQAAWSKAVASKAIVLDLRDCGGGWPSASEYLLDSLLGPGHKSFVAIDRSGKVLPSEPAFAAAPRFRGRVVVLQSAQTQSECEVLSASLKEAGRATLVGERSAGALNGYTLAVGLPNSFARFALPYTRSVSPAGREYEGVGVEADVGMRNTATDFNRHRDAVLDEAMRIIQGSPSDSK